MAGKKFTKLQDGLHYKVNTRTGELEEASITLRVDNDSWIMLFFNCLKSFLALTGNQMRLLAVIWKYSSYNPNNTTEGNVFINGPHFKQVLKEYGLDWSDSQINNEISKLAKTDLMNKISRGTYILNPEYFFKGTLVDRTKLIATIKNTFE